MIEKNKYYEDKLVNLYWSLENAEDQPVSSFVPA